MTSKQIAVEYLAPKIDDPAMIFKNINIFALGGIINENQIKQISETKAYGFASIRYFV